MPSVYIETTIPSYLTARPSRDLIIAAHQQMTRDWWDNQRQRFDLYIPQLVLDEAAGGDPVAASARMDALAGFPLLDVDEEVSELAVAILGRGALPARAAVDAAHIAVAAVHHIDFLLTWNCRHIANAESVRIVRKICTELGYELPAICTPEELMGEEE